LRILANEFGGLSLGYRIGAGETFASAPHPTEHSDVSGSSIAPVDATPPIARVRNGSRAINLELSIFSPVSLQ